MAKGIFGALKGVDAFGKVWPVQYFTSSRDAHRQWMLSCFLLDYGRCEGQDAYWRVLSVVFYTCSEVYTLTSTRSDPYGRRYNSDHHDDGIS